MSESNGPSEPGEPGDLHDSYDRLRRRVMWSIPTGLYVLTACVGDRLHAMTLSWATQVAMEPKAIGVGVSTKAVMSGVLSEGRVFCLNFVSRDDSATIRKFVKPPAVDLAGMTIGGRPFRRGRTGSPILDEAAAYLDCEVRQIAEVGDHGFFIGEVVDAGFLKAEDTPILRMEDTRMNYGG